MSYTISGNYVASCSCLVLCGCPVDAKPKDVKGRGECKALTVFHIADGNLNEVDLSGVAFAMYLFLPSNLTSGNWTVGLVVDSAASDEQASSVEKILSGQEGGPFGELAQFIGTYAGMERAPVSVTDGEKPSATVGGKSEIQFQPVLGLDGAPTTIKNAMFGFAPEYQVGNSSGHSDAFGLSYEPSYGEAAEYMYSTEVAGSVRGR